MRLFAESNGYSFEIVEDKPEVGVYMYISKDGKCIRDELQNDIATCKDIAYEEYAVPEEKWIARE